MGIMTCQRCMQIYIVCKTCLKGCNINDLQNSGKQNVYWAERVSQYARYEKHAAFLFPLQILKGKEQYGTFILSKQYSNRHNFSSSEVVIC